MAQTQDNTYATTGANASAGTPNKVTVVNDGAGDRQVVVLGAGDGTTTLVDGTPANPLNSKLTNGTNTADVVAGDSGFNGVATASGSLTIPFTTSATGAQILLANTKVEGYSSIQLVLTSVGTGVAWTAQTSNASGGIYSGYSNTWQVANTGTSNPGGLGLTSGATYSSYVQGNYFQLNISTMASGTTTGYIILSNTPVVYHNTGVSAGQSGTWTVGSNSATGSAVPANAFYMGGSDTGGNLRGIALGVNDGAAQQSLVANEIMNYNGATFDRMRNNMLVAPVASGTTATSSTTTTTYNARSAVIIINVSAYTSGTINIAINLLTSSGYSYSPFTSITGLAATGTVVYRIGPGLTPSAGLTANDVLGRSLQIVTSGTFSATYGIDVNLSV